MKILHLSFYDDYGGAGKAALRILNSQLNSKIDANMLVCSKHSFNKNVFSIKKTFSLKLNNIVVRIINFFLVKIFKQQSVYSLNLLPSRLSKIINQSDYDIVNFHWINHEMISLYDISKISKPIIWTLHDNWPFSSIEHYIKKNDNRFTLGYNNNNSSNLEKFLWRKKLEVFEKKILSVVAPSKWMEGLVSKSIIFKNKKIYQIPYPIDTKNFFPENFLTARKNLNLVSLKKNVKIISFGATSAYSEQRKGYNFIKQTIIKLNKEKKNVHFIIFGELAKDLYEFSNITNYQEISDEKKIRDIYNASDIFLCPSLQDNLPLTVMESITCGTPVVSFDVGGLKDLILHKKNGYLAKEESFEDFYNGINFFLNLDLKNNNDYLNVMEYNKITNNFNPNIIAEKYNKIYKEIINL